MMRALSLWCMLQQMYVCAQTEYPPYFLGPEPLIVKFTTRKTVRRALPAIISVRLLEPAHKLVQVSHSRNLN